MSPELSHFLCTSDELYSRIDKIDARAYDKTRNYLDGSVTWLSPFITHGIIDTTTVATRLLTSYKPKQCYRFLFELAWREYFHRTWHKYGDAIFKDLLSEQGRDHSLVPLGIQQGETGIDALDGAIKHLLEHGSLHNHARMWIAGITCNTAQTQWLEPAKWMHYHLLDGDLASNTLSWQWVAGTFSHKQYIANQDNLNKYSATHQKNTWLDCTYEDLAELPIPAALEQRAEWQEKKTDLAECLAAVNVSELTGDVAVRSIWNLDPVWRSDVKQQILFIDSDFHNIWPLSPKRWQFIRHWIPEGTKVMTGATAELTAACQNASVVHREYPVCEDWPGEKDERRWLYPTPVNEYSSFSQFWKQVKSDVGL